MKAFGKSLKKILTAALTLTLCASSLALATLPASAADADPFTNLFDKSTALAGIVNAANLQENPNSQYYTSAYIEVKKGDIIRFGPANPGQAYHLHGYGSTTSIVAPMVKAESLSTAQEIYGNPDGNGVRYKFYVYTVPEGVNGIRVVCESKMASAFTITKNQQLNTTKYFDYWRAPERAEAFRAAGGYVAENLDKSPLVGRSALFIGDSITHGNRESSLLYQGWASRIGEAYDMTYQNSGKNGATVAVYSGLSQTVAQISNNKYDFVIMHGGINDFTKNINIGTLTAKDNVNGPYDTATFAGGLENLFKAVKAKYPNAKLGYIINYQLTSDVSKVGNFGVTAATAGKFPQYADMIKAACEKWGIPYLDLSTNEFKTMLKVDTQEYLPDYLHLNGAGYDLVTPYIATFMESLAPEWVPSDEPVEKPDDDQGGNEVNPPVGDEDGNDEVNNTDGETETTAAATEAETAKASDETTEAPAEGGCGASVGGAAIALTAAAAGVMIKKKKED